MTGYTEILSRVFSLLGLAQLQVMELSLAVNFQSQSSVDYNHSGMAVLHVCDE